MIPILVLIQDRNVLSFAMCTRRFRTLAILLSSEIFGEHFDKYRLIAEKNPIYLHSLAVPLLLINHVYKLKTFATFLHFSYISTECWPLSACRAHAFAAALF